MTETTLYSNDRLYNIVNGTDIYLAHLDMKIGEILSEPADLLRSSCFSNQNTSFSCTSIVHMPDMQQVVNSSFPTVINNSSISLRSWKLKKKNHILQISSPLLDDISP